MATKKAKKKAVGGVAVELTWLERLTRAVKRRRFTESDQNKAGDWRTCAVSEVPIGLLGRGAALSARIPGDEALVGLGMAFDGNVQSNDVPKALATYYAIQDRRRELRAGATA